MKIFNNTLAAIDFIDELKISQSDKIVKKINIQSIGITKVNNTIIIVDEYGLLD
tara:strand:+ start:428 stop:589 length:162 start_codon:yes stop_codon:yes gene_type:complete